MGFLENLAKGFVRSAVNQVGRDTGKVVSNKIYGDAHATPIRGINLTDGIYYDETNDTPIPEAEFVSRLHKEGYRISYFSSNPIYKWIVWMLAIPVTGFMKYCWGDYYAMIPAGLLILAALLKILIAKNVMRVYQYKELTTYKRDNRYRDGKRFAGFSKAKIDYELKPTKDFLIKSSLISIVYIFFAIWMYWTAYNINSVEGLDMWIYILKSSIPVIGLLSVMHILLR